MPRRGYQTFHHPLSDFVLKLFERRSVLDVTVVSGAIAGGYVKPKKGERSYRIVAADVLMVMAGNGLVHQHGSIDKSKPEDGGHWYTKA